MVVGAVPQYRDYTYRAVRAESAAVARARYAKLWGYVPDVVFGPVGCGDAPESPYVHAGEYNCALIIEKEVEHDR